MNKVLKIIIYCIGICLVVGLGIWAELNSGRYPHLQNSEGKVSIENVVGKSGGR
jgi:hypothetical protein